PDCSVYTSALASGETKSNDSVTLAVAAAQRIVRNRALAPSAMTSLIAVPLAVMVPAASAPVSRRWKGGVMIAGCFKVGVFAATVYSWWGVGARTALAGGRLLPLSGCGGSVAGGRAVGTERRKGYRLRSALKSTSGR